MIKFSKNALYVKDGDTALPVDMLIPNNQEKAIEALRRKVMAISGGMLVFRKMLYAQQFQIHVERDSSGNASALSFKIGAFKQKVRIGLSNGSAGFLRVYNLQTFNFNTGSMYIDVPNRKVEVVNEINLDNKSYGTLSNFIKEMDDETFFARKFVISYDSTGTVGEQTFTCTTTICITSNDLTVMETIDNAEYTKNIPTGFIEDATDAAERVFEKAVHGKRRVFTYGRDDGNVLVETVEIDGLTSFRKISFGGAD